MTNSFKSDVEIQTLINDAWLNIDIKEHQLFNPLTNIPRDFENDPHLYIAYLMMQPEYFSLLCNEILNTKLLPFQALLLKILYEYKFPMFIGSRGSSKSYLLAVYCIIRALTIPGRKIVIAGSTFRQSKIVFEYMEKIWYNAPRLRDLCNKCKQSGPHHGTDMWRFYIGDSVVSAIPVGNTGDSVRGLRANDLIVEEFKCLRSNTLCETDKGLVRIKDISTEKIINKYGKYEQVVNTMISPKTPILDIRTKYGYSIQCSPQHKILTKDGWKQAQYLNQNDYLAFSNLYIFPNNETISESEACLLATHIKEKLMYLDIFLPDIILQSKKSIVVKFLSILFDNKFGLCIRSETLARDIHTLLLKLDIISILEYDSLYKYILYFDPIQYHKLQHLFLNPYSNDFHNIPSFLPVDRVVPLNITEDLYDLTTETTHSFYADGFVQHNSQDRLIFETVLAGFGAVSADPVENVQRIASEKMAKQLGIILDEADLSTVSNQLIVSGTAYYQFNHFYDYWKRWKAIINNKMKSDGQFAVNYKDYCVIRLPIELIPEGFMDVAQIARSKASMHSGNFQCEYQSIFSTDSHGFFKRSIIEAATVSETSNIVFPSCGKVMFYPTLVGNPKCRYIMGVDPASENDNFAIVILELHPEHKRVVYAWTITRKEQEERVKDKYIPEIDFFGFCARKIRNLLKVFPISMIGLDSQGGGYAVLGALLRTDNPGDLPIYEIIESGNPKDTDGKSGLHLVNKVQFANHEWMSQSNNNLRLDIENRVLLFPHYDALTETFATFIDETNNTLYDTLEDCVYDIKEMKDELSTIIMTSTDSGRDKWTTPDKKEPGMKKGKMHKDRYTALLIAHATASLYNQTLNMPTYTVTIGGFAGNIREEDRSGVTFVGPDWIKQMQNIYD